jgi:hypothetical protein
MRRAALLAILALRVAAPAWADDDPHQHPGGRPEELGTVHFPTTCKAATQAPFERAVAMLHSFWYEEAIGAFEHLAETDPDCAMAHWGLAMSLWHPIWIPPATPAALERGRAVVARARAARTQSPREGAYVTAVAAYFEGPESLDSRSRALAYEKAMVSLHSAYPDDREGAAFYALSLLATASLTDKTYANQLKAASLLEPIFAEQPHHPGAAHYIIHSFDVPALATRALPAARAYAKIAPSAPHALHMPSHIFTRLGLWDESIASNRASEQAAKDYAARAHMEGAWDEQLHAMDYLEYAYLQGAQDSLARAVLEELQAITKVEPANAKTGYAFAAVPARFALERRQWAEAATLVPRPGATPWAEALTHFARGTGLARSGDTAGAQREAETLAQLRDALVAAKDPYWADQVEIERRAVAGWAALSAGRGDEAAGLVRSAAELEDRSEKMPVTPGPVVPAREQLGDLLLELKRPAEALREFEAALVGSPNRFGGLAGAFRAATLAGDRPRAVANAQALMALCPRAEGGRPELAAAKATLAHP